MAMYCRPKIAQPSTLIKDVHFEVVWSWLPPRYQLLDPLHRYVSATDGYSLSRLLHTIEEDAPLLLLKAADRCAAFLTHRVLGVFIPFALTEKNKYFGNGEAFIFRVDSLAS